MFSDPNRVREARVFARPFGTGSLQLIFEPAVDGPARERIAGRLIGAYRLAVQDARSATMQAADSDLWTAIVAQQLPELVALLDSADAPGLARFLQRFGAEYTWFGGAHARARRILPRTRRG